MNKKNDIYFLVFGKDRYHFDSHFQAAKYKFDFLSEARKASKVFENAYICKAHLAADSGDVLYFEKIGLVLNGFTMPPITQTAFMQISRSINSVGDSFFKRTNLYKKQRQAYTPAVVLLMEKDLFSS